MALPLLYQNRNILCAALLASTCDCYEALTVKFLPQLGLTNANLSPSKPSTIQPTLRIQLLLWCAIYELLGTAIRSGVNLPRTHHINVPLYCCYRHDIPSQRVEGDASKARLLMDRYLPDIVYVIP